MSILKTLFGVDSFLNQPSFYKNSRIGFVTNNAAITSAGELSRLALIKAGFNITKLFSPEHGLNAVGIDGSFQQNITDNITGLPVISLYGDKLSPNKKDLGDVDMI